MGYTEATRKERTMARYKKDNGLNYFKGECQKCKGEVTRRNSRAVQLDARQDNDYVVARGKGGRVVTRKALPRIHKGKCPE